MLFEFVNVYLYVCNNSLNVYYHVQYAQFKTSIIVYYYILQKRLLSCILVSETNKSRNESEALQADELRAADTGAKPESGQEQKQDQERERETEMRKNYIVFKKDCMTQDIRKLTRRQAEQLRRAGYEVERL